MLAKYFLGSQKAIVGGAVTGLLSLLALVGVSGEMTVKEALVALGNWVIAHLAVWYTTNKK
jgi:hypothetical protein